MRAALTDVAESALNPCCSSQVSQTSTEGLGYDRREDMSPSREERGSLDEENGTCPSPGEEVLKGVDGV